MTDPTDISRGIACRCTSHKRCKEAALVLQSVGINSEILPWEGEFLLVVQIKDATEAARQLSEYEHENRPETVNAEPQIKLSKGMHGAMVYAAILLLADGLVQSGAFSGHMVDLGSTRAGLIRDGQWWRAVTALTLHADSAHLWGNLSVGIVFGLFASQSLGSGLAWFSILLAGTVGNLLSASFQDPGHTSIGASTAVFAALGIQAAHTWRSRHLYRYKGVRRWSPLIGGVILLALLGGPGERIDVLSHLTGFLSGLLLGALLGHKGEILAKRGTIQGLFSGAGVLLIILAWWMALLPTVIE
ncbi:MAG: rhomboid family intramembrane serine protease [bacterium]|nr:rhomboid family intramembrane serine protease [bacterium]